MIFIILGFIVLCAVLGTIAAGPRIKDSFVPGISPFPFEEFTEVQQKIVDEIIRKRDSQSKRYTVEQLSWRYAVWNGEELIGEQDILGRLKKIY